MDVPQVRYARLDEASIAYQRWGAGPDLVFVGGLASNVEVLWEESGTAATLERLGRFARVTMFDRRGTGLSDPVDRPLELERQMDELLAVADAAGLGRFTLAGGSDLGLAVLVAATYPERVAALYLWGVAARGRDLIPPDQVDAVVEIVREHWGRGDFAHRYAPSRVADPRFCRWWAKYERSCAAPGMAARLLDLVLRIDMTAVLPTIRVPTLVVHARDDAAIPTTAGREVAGLIPGARFLEVAGTDNYGWTPGSGFLEPLEEFVTGRRTVVDDTDRVLATVLFTDLCSSTERAAGLGDRAWRGLLERHDTLVRAEIERHRGRWVKSLGDGVLATFDGPARALRCAAAVLEGIERLGLEVRAGLHTGECEMLTDGDVGGLAVHIAARVLSQAQPGEVLATRTVRDLVVGSGLAFADRGEHELRGVPGSWLLVALA